MASNTWDEWDGRVIICLDMDCFYAQVIEKINPQLKGKPLAIKQKYILVTCNYEARDAGVTKLMSIEEAKKACPELQIVDGSDLTPFRHASTAIYDVWTRFFEGCPVERAGFDEVFVDVTQLVEKRIQFEQQKHQTDSPVLARKHEYTGFVFSPGDAIELREDQTGVEQSVNTFEELNTSTQLSSPLVSCSISSREMCETYMKIGSQIADTARTKLFEELGYKCCAGIGGSKFASKVAGELHKPNQQTCILPRHFNAIVADLNLRKLPGFGYQTVKKIRALFPEVKSAKDFRSIPQDQLAVALFDDDRARTKIMWAVCWGVDCSEVSHSGLPKTLSQEDTCLPHPTTRQAALVRLMEVTERTVTMVQARLEESGDYPRVLRISIRNKFKSKGSTFNRHFERQSKQCALPSHLFHPSWLPQLLSAINPLVIGLLDAILSPSGQPFQLSRINVGVAQFVLEPPSKPPQATSTLFRFLSNTSSNSNSSPSVISITNSTMSASPTSNTGRLISNFLTSLSSQPQIEGIQQLPSSPKGTKHAGHSGDTVAHRSGSTLVNNVQNSVETYVEKSGRAVNSCSAASSSSPKSPIRLQYSRIRPCDVDDSVLAELPPELRCEIEAELRSLDGGGGASQTRTNHHVGALDRFIVRKRQLTDGSNRSEVQRCSKRRAR